MPDAHAPATQHPVDRPTQRPHVAALVEDWWCSVAGAFLRRRGWVPRMLAYTGCGSPRGVRVLARVLLVPPSRARGPLSGVRHADRRPLRSYLTLPAPREPVRVAVGGAVVDVLTESVAASTITGAERIVRAEKHHAWRFTLTLPLKTQEA